MKSNSYDLARLQNRLDLSTELQSKKFNYDVFADRNTAYINELGLFLAHFNTIPNYIDEIKIDCKKASNWLLMNYENEIKDCHFNMRYFNQQNIADYDDVVYILFEDLLIDFDTSCSFVRFLFRKTEISRVEEVISGIRKFKERKELLRPEISLLVTSQHGIITKSLKITKPKLRIEDNYNDDFIGIHQTILKRLSRKNDKGMVLLHGKPGTGKTYYIRYLVASLKKDVIFLPSNLATSITSPDLISVLMMNSNSIFVIEDAENVIMDREKNGMSPVTALLNISDGLLSDCLNIQVICSFNTDLSRIDNALMRKGRLIAKYEFRELDISKAQALSDKLGYKTKIEVPMTLSAIYNQEEREYNRIKKIGCIGFKTMMG